MLEDEVPIQPSHPVDPRMNCVRFVPRHFVDRICAESKLASSAATTRCCKGAAAGRSTTVANLMKMIASLSVAAYPDANSSKIAANAVAIVKQIDERLALGLRTRGLMAEAASVQARDRSIGTALQEHDLKIGGNLLVMGGYGHSRVRDFVLGGATEDILTDLRLPVLLSH
ncbi:mlr6573 [Mesorhizobium japonicum MAFF 303099]|uniref:Mlr6573 protein n=1 Tax=Mesorhizobium japonicum (strain LMG 29417 / CECT 9101 / MAFF 303099) TaxID=266835 RepID=Q988V9_RHILO|nr:mlr6573 [Mesorhizobium japonicum MAFF 303099]